MDILEYLDNSPSPAWAAASATEILKAAGFVAADGGALTGLGKFYTRPHPGMVLAALLPEKINPDSARFRIIGAHTDSPHLRLKPNAASESAGTRLLLTEIYGGALLYTWFDRELGLAGEVYYKDGARIAHKLIRIDKPVAIVPSLAIHLQRGVNEDGFVPAKNSETSALMNLCPGESDLSHLVAERAAIASERILSYDLSLYDLRKALRGGSKDELLFSARLDNLVSCYTAVSALASTEAKNTIKVIALFDHEEVGSVSESGAHGAVLENFLKSTWNALGLKESTFSAALAQSVFVSADMAHGLHPSNADKHDTENRPKLGGGVTLKVNQNRRYATSAATQAIFHDLCNAHNIASQVYTHRNDLPCGSTIGPTVSARLGIPTMDVGVAMLAMHSIRETCAWADLEEYGKFMKAFLASWAA